MGAELSGTSSSSYTKHTANAVFSKYNPAPVKTMLCSWDAQVGGALKPVCVTNQTCTADVIPHSYVWRESDMVVQGDGEESGLFFSIASANLDLGACQAPVTTRAAEEG